MPSEGGIHAINRAAKGHPCPAFPASRCGSCPVPNRGGGPGHAAAAPAVL